MRTPFVELEFKCQRAAFDFINLGGDRIRASSSTSAKFFSRSPSSSKTVPTSSSDKDILSIDKRVLR